MPDVKARIKGIFRPSDLPANADEAAKKDIAALFATLAPGNPNPEISGASAGFAMAAVSPGLAKNLVGLSLYMARELPWAVKNPVVKELAVQAAHLHFKCQHSFASHYRSAQKLGLSPELQAAIPFWRTTNVFDDEQRLVIEYAFAVCAGDVPEALFAKIVKRYGEAGAVECTTVIAWWSFWAMIVNAVDPKFDFGKA